MNRVEFDIPFRLSVISIGRPTRQGSHFYTDCTALKCTILVSAYPLLAFLAESEKKPSCFRVAKAVGCRRVMGPGSGLDYPCKCEHRYDLHSVVQKEKVGSSCYLTVDCEMTCKYVNEMECSNCAV
jgi:hypothetical protein